MLWNVILITALLIVIDSEYYNNPMKHKSKRKKKVESKLLNWQIYHSDRFTIKGNMMYQLTIKDSINNVQYTLMHSELIVFRENWQHVDEKNEENFIIAHILSLKSKPITVIKVA